MSIPTVVVALSALVMFVGYPALSSLLEMLWGAPATGCVSIPTVVVALSALVMFVGYPALSSLLEML